MGKATLAHAPAPTDEQIDRILNATADSFVQQLRSPIVHAPSEQKLAYEEVTAASSTDTPEGRSNVRKRGLRWAAVTDPVVNPKD